MDETLTARQRAIVAGYRSGLEERTADYLRAQGIPFAYEEHTVYYTKPARNTKYTPDFVLENGIIIETKGRFLTEDRQKMILIKKQWPDLDIRMVFSNPKTKISKKSLTTYAMWCERQGYLYAKGDIPTSWLNETPNPVALAAIVTAGIRT